MSHLGAHQFEITLIEFQKACEIAPNFSPAHMNVGAALRNLHRYGEALVEYETAAKIGPPDPEIFLGIADTYALAGESGNAIQMFEQALMLNPSHTYASKRLERLRAAVY